MRVTQRIAALAITLIAAGFPPLAAQIDYRNLDDHRPVRTEDAYPIERYAFELLVPYEYENAPAGEARHAITPELGDHLRQPAYDARHHLGCSGLACDSARSEA
jgi:hypothetical protein